MIGVMNGPLRGEEYHPLLTSSLSHAKVRRMKIDSDDFRVRSGKRVKLKRWPTDVKAYFDSKQHYESLLEEHTHKLSVLQSMLYAQDRYAVLLIFQAMDAAGKDGAIKHVMSGVNPQGCQVYSFKHPSAEELEHDFLWRTTRCLPERGRIGIFNRSYYEEVLIVRVHPEILQAENLPDKLQDDKSIWQERFRSILDQESHLYRNATKIVKFFLHVSKEEQRKRFLQRIDDPDKNWKFSQTDVEERKFWDDYTLAYEDALTKCNTAHAPWFIIPSNKKWFRNLAVSHIIAETMEDMDMKFPPPSIDVQKLKWE